MAPSIIQLEVTRLGQIINSLEVEDERRNELVRSRYNMRVFMKCIAKAEKESVSELCARTIRDALLALTISHENLPPKTGQTLNYVSDRLNYVLNRIELIY